MSEQKRPSGYVITLKEKFKCNATISYYRCEHANILYDEKKEEDALFISADFKEWAEMLAAHINKTYDFVATVTEFSLVNDIDSEISFEEHEALCSELDDERKKMRLDNEYSED